MRRTILIFLAVISVIFILPLAVSADGFDYDIDYSNNTALITGYEGEVPENLVIPSILGNCSVTGLGDCSFSNFINLKSVIIPDSVTSIGFSVFENCTNLKNVTIGKGVNFIGFNVFYNCAKLESISVDIGNQKYSSEGNCIIDKSEKLLVAGCKNSIIPVNSSVTVIGDLAFAGCTGLVSITIPDCITSIGNNAFIDCKNLNSIKIPSGVKNIGDSVFVNCEALSSISVADGNPTYHSAGNCIIETSSHVLVIGCKNSIIPDDGSVTSIGCDAFKNCSGLVSITIPYKVTSIEMRAFDQCANLSSITFPEGLVKIEVLAFNNCKNLNSITIPGSVENIATKAFSDCEKLGDVYFEGKAPEIEPAGSWGSFPESAVLHYIAGKTGWTDNKDKYDTIRGTWCRYRIETWDLTGDINYDGEVNASDAQLLAHYIAGFTVVSFNETNADIDFDGAITPRDSMILARHLAGWTGYETLPYRDPGLN